MTLCQMLLHNESAFDCLIELGYLGVVQFNNLTDGDHVPNLKFTSEVQRCSDMQRILVHLQTEIENAGIRIVYYPDVDEEEIPRSGDMRDIELTLVQLEEELTDVDENWDTLRKKTQILHEKLHVMYKAQEFLRGAASREAVMAWSDSVVMSLLHDESEQAAGDTTMHTRLGFLAGSIEVKRFQAFELMLWRLCRTNFYMKHAEIPPPPMEGFQVREPNRQFAFMVFFVGEVLREKILKVCQGFRVKLFECPESSEARAFMAQYTANELAEIQVILKTSDDHRRRILLVAAADIYIWMAKMKKMLMVYFVLNSLSTVQGIENQKYLEAECWIPTKDIREVRMALFRGATRFSQGEDNSTFTPILAEKQNTNRNVEPTYFSLNKFTRGFQNLIDAYGIAVYRELNPAPYTIITFPFLFAVMFGDMGHGAIITAFAAYMVIKERQLLLKKKMETKSNEIWDILFAGRYVILLMGVFSIYTGAIYNDVFSKSFNVFGSHWRVNYKKTEVAGSKHLQLNPGVPEFYMGTPYVFGMDPVWDASGESAITTFNSLKMKMAVILGVSQMLFGLGLAAANFVHTNNLPELYLVWMPQLLFLICVFAYLIFLIFFKWCMYGGHKETPYNSACAPSILMTFIDMILWKDSGKPLPGCEHKIYPQQVFIELLLLAVALLCVPLLLLGKPLYYMRESRKIARKFKDARAKAAMRRSTLQAARKSLLVYHVEYTEESIHNMSTQADVYVMSELWIHQGIHCIESVLGSVSHTASYLRLWALSLAHDQLSTVLWNMVLGKALTVELGYLSSIMIYLVFWFWAVLTLAILIVMEGLSAFLHTLRLHWVEFQSKFYTGSGENFYPFRFEPSTLK